MYSMCMCMNLLVFDIICVPYPSQSSFINFAQKVPVQVYIDVGVTKTSKGDCLAKTGTVKKISHTYKHARKFVQGHPTASHSYHSTIWGFFIPGKGLWFTPVCGHGVMCVRVFCAKRAGNYTNHRTWPTRGLIWEPCTVTWIMGRGRRIGVYVHWRH